MTSSLSNSPTFLIIDDESNQIEQLKRGITAMYPDATIYTWGNIQTDTVESLTLLLTEHRPNIALVDGMMHDAQNRDISYSFGPKLLYDALQGQEYHDIHVIPTTRAEGLWGKRDIYGIYYLKLPGIVQVQVSKDLSTIKDPSRRYASVEELFDTLIT